MDAHNAQMAPFQPDVIKKQKEADKAFYHKKWVNFIRDIEI